MTYLSFISTVLRLFVNNKFWQTIFGMSCATYILALLLIPPFIRGEIEICTGGPAVLQITNDSCPFGILFMEPQSAECLVFTGEDENAILADVCTKEPYNPAAKQFQFLPEISPDSIEPGNSCKTTMPAACSQPSEHVRRNSFLHPASPFDFQFEPDKNDSNNAVVKNQTRRMFEYLMGLGNLEIDDSPRLIELLKQSVEIVKTYCDSRFLKTAFFDDVLAAFMFLRQESDLTGFQDIPLEEYDLVKKSLQSCMTRRTKRNPIMEFEGKRCATYSMIQSVNKSGELFSEFDKSNYDSFLKYDVPVEATWGAVDFVHGLCYGTFRDYINMHHLYQQAMEKLFTKEILFRWQNRYVFQGQQQIWSNFFSANVKNALVNMDICIQASYFSTPFLHRLERPIDAQPKSRKRRWTEPHSLKNLQSVEAICFQTKEEADSTLTSYCE